MLALKCVLLNFIAMYPPDLPSRLYASGSSKTNEEEASTGHCSGRHEYNPELFVATTAAEDETSEGNPGNRNGDAVEVAPRYQRLKTNQRHN